VIGHLPNLLIIGAAKAGTSSLHAYLAEHPEISMSSRKELELFNRDDWREHLDDYRKNFFVRAPIRGESSPAYSMNPHFEHVPERIHACIPRARIIYLVRDPVERAIAQYTEWRFVGVERRSFERAFADFDRPTNAYVMSSRYGHQVQLYREHFPDSRILVLDQRSLLRERHGTLRRVFEFLGVDKDFWTSRFEREHNTGQEKILVNSRGRWLGDHNLYLPTMRAVGVLPGRLRRAVVSTLGVPLSRPEPEPSLVEAMRELFSDDVEWLRDYTGESFDHWSA